MTYQKKDIEDLRHHFDHADELWYDEWVRQGEKSYGSCCTGKAIIINYLPPRCKYPKEYKIVHSPPCQGNQSAYASVGPALEYLKAQGIECSYYDGRMD
jgi:hypothetical protein